MPGIYQVPPIWQIMVIILDHYMFDALSIQRQFNANYFWNKS